MQEILLLMWKLQLFSLRDPEETVSCPYNKAHQIIRKRMQTHLVKCSKNYQDTNLQVCIYNAVHKVPEPEMKVDIHGSLLLHRALLYFVVSVSLRNLSRPPQNRQVLLQEGNR